VSTRTIVAIIAVDIALAASPQLRPVFFCLGWEMDSGYVKGDFGQNGGWF